VGCSEGFGDGACDGAGVGRFDGNGVGAGTGASDVVGCDDGNRLKAPLAKQNSASSESPVPRSVGVTKDASLISHETECAGFDPSRTKAKQLLLPTHA
jgi:hypothetical protein